MNFAVMRADLAVFPISPRNSAIAVAHLLQKVQVDHVLLGHERAMQELVASAFDILRSDHKTLPSTSFMPQFEDLYGGSDVQWAPLPPMGKQDITEIAMILHSSGMNISISPAIPSDSSLIGSTAFPKPIGWSHYVLLGSGRWPRKPSHSLFVISVPEVHSVDYHDRDMTGMRVSCHATPMYHGAGVSTTFWTVRHLA